nr:DUF3991 and TOPRIM domain-containing protein [Clostridia bacterium]
MRRIPDELLELARRMDLFTYLSLYEPQELVHVGGREYCTREHDSLKISNGLWCWHSRDDGGATALDYLIKVKNIPFRKAVTIILAKELQDTPVFNAENTPGTDRKLVLPERNLTDNRVKSYLKSRGIDRELIDCCINKGYLYESAPYHNCVFVGFDEQGKPRYASFRATNGTKIKGEAKGSDKRYSFRIMHPSDTLHAFESAIDLLSYMTIVKKTTGKWPRESMVSLGGVYARKRKNTIPKVPICHQSAIQSDNNLKKIVLHLDNDTAGRQATESIIAALHDYYEVIDEPPKCGKDMNDELIALITEEERRKPYAKQGRNDTGNFM